MSSYSWYEEILGLVRPATSHWELFLPASDLNRANCVRQKENDVNQGPTFSKSSQKLSVVPSAPHNHFPTIK